MPSNHALMLMQYNDILATEKAKRYKQDVHAKQKIGVMPVVGLHEANGDLPAGFRAPKPFKKTYVDKIPEWVEKLRKEGKSDEEIKAAIRGKELKYISKWGNKSKVGAIINEYNQETIDNDLEANAVHSRTLALLSPSREAKISTRNTSLPAIKRTMQDQKRRANRSLVNVGRGAAGVSVPKERGAMYESLDQARDAKMDLEHFVTTNQTFN